MVRCALVGQWFHSSAVVLLLSVVGFAAVGMWVVERASVYRECGASLCPFIVGASESVNRSYFEAGDSVEPY